ncbi:transglutaminase family protein [Acuticoccus mangrovi]|uniref:Transglutaminase family protein n=1 Tax=Acuticoccus mangrovi TaxID=2796142 RepID=A0A934MF23_9HYPH|nr:transglutaminase family protein [Acuticoccus mangrovi]
MLYNITLTIGYAYDYPAAQSRHVVRLMPADIAGEQRLVAGTLSVTPKPAEWLNWTDYFGNATVEVAFREPHEEIDFEVKSRVERLEGAPLLDMSPRIGDLAADIAAHRMLDPRSPYHFAGNTRRVTLDARTTRYARDTLRESMSTLDAVKAIGEAIHGDMRYDPEATTVETPMLEAFEKRHGVCQDFTHIMIACLRGVGIPAGYVSGFLRTNPPAGEPRLEGADAMHAWVSAWCGGEVGWVEYDPTNRVLAGADHVVIAHGRDYSDVAPVRGVMRSHGDHTSKQAVDVVPITA